MNKSILLTSCLMAMVGMVSVANAENSTRTTVSPDKLWQVVGETLCNKVSKQCQGKTTFGPNPNVVSTQPVVYKLACVQVIAYKHSNNTARTVNNACGTYTTTTAVYLGSVFIPAGDVGDEYIYSIHYGQIWDARTNSWKPNTWSMSGIVSNKD